MRAFGVVRLQTRADSWFDPRDTRSGLIGSIMHTDPVARPRVVVGMPVYNSARWLDSTIASWLSQSRSEFRLLISDNASTDSSFSICQEFARRDPRVAVNRNARNIGVYGNFRRVLELGRDGDYFMWAASHDFFSPTYLERCVATLESRPDCVLCCGRTKLFTGDVSNAADYPDVPLLEEDAPLVRFRSIITSLNRNNLVHGVFRMGALRNARGLGDHFSADTVLVAHLALMGKIVQLRDVTYYRRIDPEACTQRWSEAEKERHLDPENAGKTFLTHWKVHRGLARAVLQTTLSVRQKLAGLWLIAKFVYWDRRELASDIADRLRRRARDTGVW